MEHQLLTEQEQAEYEISWLDAALDAAGFFAMENIVPVQAAMLLCRLSPHDETLHDAETSTTDETTHDDFKRLLATFEDRAAAKPRARSLLDWMTVANDAGRKTHSWAVRYAKHHGLFGPPAPKPAQTPVSSEPPFEGMPVSELNVESEPNEQPKAKRLTWKDASIEYILQVMQNGQYATCKELYRALSAKAGPDSPFDKGTGSNLGSLFVREIGQPLSLKTMQNAWSELRERAKK